MNTVKEKLALFRTEAGTIFVSYEIVEDFPEFKRISEYVEVEFPLLETDNEPKPN